VAAQLEAVRACKPQVQEPEKIDDEPASSSEELVPSY
jgi:hypothetical protein